MLDFRRVIELKEREMFYLTDEMLEQLQPSCNFGLFPEALPMVLVLNQVRKFYGRQLAILPTKQKINGLHLFMPICKGNERLVIDRVDGSTAIAIEFWSYFELVVNGQRKPPRRT